MRELNQGDFDILKSVENIVDGIAAMFGKHTEVVLHSLDARAPSIIKIANSHITGRSVGALITNLVLMKLNDEKNISEPYITEDENGKTLRSVSIIIRNPQKQAIGLLCINSNLDASFLSVIKNLVPNFSTPTDTPSPETFARSNDEMMEDSIENIRCKVMANKNISASQKSREMITQLYQLGIFDLKDSIQAAATTLHISVHTIYRYLRELREVQPS
ncbi:putative transcriptional regulator YheO [Sinobacterium caligoides]|uniref:Putative transcriptional regulator YheO n=1 Tax=Sinobacterium caligoides TaxID=933926 RepID=A0A3N2DY26_9GAMM|nr:PAS domain-containing protein [Sinobacterium caligoides]ROS04687.1 putative transcriptional regulator YheO [Sinobacterium caligoides]